MLDLQSQVFSCERAWGKPKDRTHMAVQDSHEQLTRDTIIYKNSCVPYHHSILVLLGILHLAEVRMGGFESYRIVVCAMRMPKRHRCISCRALSSFQHSSAFRQSRYNATMGQDRSCSIIQSHLISISNQLKSSSTSSHQVFCSNDCIAKMVALLKTLGVLAAIQCLALAIPFPEYAIRPYTPLL